MNKYGMHIVLTLLLLLACGCLYNSPAPGVPYIDIATGKQMMPNTGAVVVGWFGNSYVLDKIPVLSKRAIVWVQGKESRFLHLGEYTCLAVPAGTPIAIAVSVDEVVEDKYNGIGRQTYSSYEIYLYRRDYAGQVGEVNFIRMESRKPIATEYIATGKGAAALLGDCAAGSISADVNKYLMK